jgi:hypothetical protein
MEAEAEGSLDKGAMILVPQLVTSATPSDEIEFKPNAYLGLMAGSGEGIKYSIEDITVLAPAGIEYKREEFDYTQPGTIDYVYDLKTGEGSAFKNRVGFIIEGSSGMSAVKILPAVQNYYQDYVFAGQSRLGYHSSGLAIMPELPLYNNRAFLATRITWELDTAVPAGGYDRTCSLIVGE